MEYTVYVRINNENTSEEDYVEVRIDLDELCELEDSMEKIEYIKKETQKQQENISLNDIEFEDSDLQELVDDIEDLFDTSDMHPNEDFDEFMDHEDFE